MLLKYDNESIRLIGRWSKTQNCAIATATGSTIEFAFYGDMAVMHFNMTWSEHPYPHLWIIVDDGAKIEVPMDSYIRIAPQTEGLHIVKVIYKCSVEMQHRWYEPLIGKIAFEGVEVDAAGALPPNTKKTIEFVGDSITEGVLIDESYMKNEVDQLNRVYQDDVTATYAYLTAQNLNLEPIFMGYGAVGITHGGCGSVPKVVDAYPYCYCGAPITHDSADYILMNHGANVRGHSSEEYISGYEELLNLIIKINPNSKLIVLSAFVGCFAEELEKFVLEYNEKYNKNVLYIISKGWIPEEPLQPLRDGHKVIAEKLTEILKRELELE